MAAVQTTAQRHPLLACPRQQPHTGEELAVFAASLSAPSAAVVSDGPWCFRATTIVAAEHQRIVTGEGKGSVRLPQCEAINALLGNVKTAIAGTYHAFDFAKYPRRYLASVSVPVQPPLQHESPPAPHARRTGLRAAARTAGC